VTITPLTLALLVLAGAALFVLSDPWRRYKATYNLQRRAGPIIFVTIILTGLIITLAIIS